MDKKIGNFYIDKERETIIISIISKWEKLYITDIVSLARLIRYAEVDEIKNNYNVLSTTDGIEKRKRKLNMFILQYGKKEGSARYGQFTNKLNILNRYIKKYGEIEGYKKYGLYIKKLSVSQQKKVIREGKIIQKERSLLCKEYWMKRGYSKDESILLAKNHSNMLVKNSHSVVHVVPRIHRLNTLDYWLYNGYDYETACVMKKIQTDKSIQSKEEYKKKYGEKWEEKWDVMQEKRRIKTLKTISKNNGFKCNASKQSLLYFLPLKCWIMKKYNISEDDIYIGIDGSKEFFLANSTQYYFRYDFTIRTKKIIIDYHGERFHPSKHIIPDKEWYKWKSPYGISSTIQYNIDIKRKIVAEELGFKYYVIWSYKEYDDEIKNVMKFIEDNI